MEEITKAEWVDMAEEDDTLQYMGDVEIGGETRKFYRTKIGAAGFPRSYRVVYVVV
jgi:hypothetical protein